MLNKLIVSLVIAFLLLGIMPKKPKKWVISFVISIGLYCFYMLLLYEDSLWGILGMASLTIAIQFFFYKRHLLESGLNAVALYLMLVYLNYLTALSLLLNKGTWMGARIAFYMTEGPAWMVFSGYTLLILLTYRLLVSSMRKKIGTFKTGHLVIFAADGGILLGALGALNYLYRYLGSVSMGIKGIPGLSDLLMLGVHVAIGVLFLLLYLMNSYWMTHFNFKAYQSVAELDGLTGVLNRHSGLKRLNEVYRNSRASGNNFVLCFVDVNNLKTVNDQYGHNEGDFMIQAIAGCLESNLRGADFVCRLGGDEFLLCFVQCQLEDAQRAWDRIALAIDALNDGGQTSYKFSVSQGFASYVENRRLTIRELIELADANMYDHKRRYKQGLGQ